MCLTRCSGNPTRKHCEPMKYSAEKKYKKIKNIYYSKPWYMYFTFIKTEIVCALVYSEGTAVVVVTVILGRHGFCQLSVFSIFLEVLLFFVSAYGWIISSSWEQFIDFMIKDCRVRRSDKSLFKIEHSILFEKNIDRPELWGNSSQEIAGETGVNYVISPFTRCLLDLSPATDRIW